MDELKKKNGGLSCQNYDLVLNKLKSFLTTDIEEQTLPLASLDVNLSQIKDLFELRKNNWIAKRPI